MWWSKRKTVHYNCQPPSRFICVYNTAICVYTTCVCVHAHVCRCRLVRTHRDIERECESLRSMGSSNPQEAARRHCENIKMFYFIFPGCVCVVVSFMRTSLFSFLLSSLSLSLYTHPLSRSLARPRVHRPAFFFFFQARRIKHLSQETAGESSDVSGRMRGNTVLFLLLLL